MENSRYEVNREITRGQYCCHEYVHVLLQFLPGGTLQVYGEQKAPIVHKYTLVHRDDRWYMDVSPSLLSEPMEMEMLIMKNHMTLKGKSGKDEDILHFSKIKFKDYNSTK